jgi:hypothetical protein
VNGDPLYRQTQIAWPTIVPIVAVGAVIIPTFLASHLTVPMWIVTTILGLVLLLFSTFTVTVTSDGIVAAFGVGLIRKTLRFAEIVSFMPVRNSWLYGWGIHYFPGGVVWNASGLSAIEFRMLNGRYVRIGTADPDGLAAALGQHAAEKSGAAHELSAGRTFGASQGIALAAGAGALILVAWTLYTGFQPPAVIVTDSAVSVSSGFYRNTIPFDTIRALTLEPRLPRIGLKTNGFAARNTLRGSFRVDTWGASRLYVNLDAPPFVVIRSGDNHVAVNFSEPARTRQLFSDLAAHVDRTAR